MKFRRRGFRARRFRSKRRVMWATDEHIQGQEGYTSPFNQIVGYPLLTETNTFVNTRFAKINDTISLVHLLGRLRIGMYVSDDDTAPLTDYLVHWGIAFVKGDYDDAGTWTPPTELPDPVEPPDQQEKWLFQEYMIMSRERLAGTSGFGMRPRPQLMSNDQLLPNGSWLDLHSKRTLQYAEKPMILVRIDGDASTDLEFFVNWKFRILITNLRQS